MLEANSQDGTKEVSETKLYLSADRAYRLKTDYGAEIIPCEGMDEEFGYLIENGEIKLIYFEYVEA